MSARRTRSALSADLSESILTYRTSPPLLRRSRRHIHESLRCKALEGTPPLLSGEHTLYTDQEVTFCDPQQRHAEQFIKGNIYITNYRMAFRAVTTEGGSYSLTIPVGAISCVEKFGSVRNGPNGYGFLIICKDSRTIKFAFKSEQHRRKGAFDALKMMAFPADSEGDVFAFQFKAKFPEDGWKVYNAEVEFSRMGVGSEGGCWKLSFINKYHEKCDTYPSVLAVPSNCDNRLIDAVCNFRSKGRFPVLSWHSCRTGCSITRSSQPLCGLLNRRCLEDEAYIQKIIDTNTNSTMLHIFDARPKLNAMANIPRGGGYEAKEQYVNTQLEFLDIENIHKMRESLFKLQAVCSLCTDEQRFMLLQNSQWLHHIRAVLNGAQRIADVINQKHSSALIHCSDGWDRTSQLSSLAQMLLDPFYRTIIGFEVLVEKDWISFGHKFNQRTGHGGSAHDDDQRAPIFLQFIDCVWQMCVQFPHAFEFNEHFLVTILNHLYSCAFGTFLMDSEKIRDSLAVRARTISLWSFINSQIHVYRNQSYSEHGVLTLNTTIENLELWSNYYMNSQLKETCQNLILEPARKLETDV
eukprot:Em0012g532a